MSAHEQLRLLLDSDMSSHSLVRIVEKAGHDVLTVLSALPTNAFGEMERRFEIWFGHFPSPGQWLDRAVYLW